MDIKKPLLVKVEAFIYAFVYSCVRSSATPSEIFGKMSGATSSRGRSVCNITTWQMLFLFVEPFITALSAFFECYCHAGE